MRTRDGKLPSRPSPLGCDRQAERSANGFTMKTIFYDDDSIESFEPRSIFLAGPTAQGVIRTAWRQQALQLLARLRPEGLLIVPEFRDTVFDRSRFDNRRKRPLIPGLSSATQAILEWETNGIDHCDVLLVWMPFNDELPGRTTRSEVARAITQRHYAAWISGRPKPAKVVLGIPPNTAATGHIRYHANRAGIDILSTLEDCCAEAARLTRYYGDVEVSL